MSDNKELLQNALNFDGLSHYTEKIKNFVKDVASDLDANLDAEIQRATARENEIADALTEEAARAKNAEQALSDTIAAGKIIWNDKYTKNEIDNKFSALETNIDWKEAVATYADIAAAYPSPADGWTVNVKDTDYTYRYNGTNWIAISANAVPKATTDIDGLLSKEDYKKLSNIEENATKYIHPNEPGYKHIPSGGSDGQILMYSEDGTAVWGDYVEAVEHVEITQAEYDALPDEEKNNGMIYFITDVENCGYAEDINYSNTDSGLNASNVQEALDEVTEIFTDHKSSDDHDARYYTETEVDSLLNGKANSSHGNHVPATQTANNSVFLRNDNTWQVVTPANIGAAISTHVHNYAGSLSVGGSANSSNWLNTNDSFTYGASGLQYFNINGAAGNTKANNTPDAGWYHILRMNHANASGYLADIALPLNTLDGLWWRQIRNGGLFGWFNILDSNNYGNYCLPLSGGILTGSLTSNGILTSKATDWEANVVVNYNDARVGRLAANSNGNLGLYDVTKSKWLIRSDTNGVVYVDGRCWIYSGQSGQPTYVWGTSDGTNCCVWNPSYFTVQRAWGIPTYSDKTYYIAPDSTSFCSWKESDYKIADNVLALGKASGRWKQLFVATACSVTSDRNFKDNIYPLTNIHYQFFLKLLPVSFTFKDGESGRTHIGFISQDVESAMNELGMTSLDFAGFCKDVKTVSIMKDNKLVDQPILNENGDPEYVYSLRYEEFIALITDALHRTISRLDDIEDTNQTLMAEIENIKQKLSVGA